MPREASKCRGWEKERRNRFNEGFESLAKVLPCYDPSVKLNKIDVLSKATCAIKELQDEVNKIVSAGAENGSAKDAIVKKLQNQIKRLVIRNSQLNNVLKDAGISVPKVVGNVKNFSGKTPWSKRISPKQAKILQKNELEKENMSAELAQVKKKKTKLKTNGVPKRPAPSDKKPNKMNSKRRKLMKALATTSCFFVLSQPPAVGGLNQQCYVIPNPPIRALPKTQTNGPGFQALPTINATVPLINSTISSLGPGTLILANGTVVPIVPQSHVIVSQPSVVSKLSVASKPVLNVNLPKQSTKSSKPVLNVNLTKGNVTNKKPIENDGNLETKKHIAVRPKPCVTKTTQVNKVPIPALTSRYANSCVLLGEVSEKKKCESGRTKNPQRIKGNTCDVKRKANKRKNDTEVDSAAKKAKSNSNVNTADLEIKNGVRNSSENKFSAALVSENPDILEPTVTTNVTSTITTSAITTSTSPTANVTSESTIPESHTPIPLSEASNGIDVSQSYGAKLLAPEVLITEVESSVITQNAKSNIGTDQKVDNGSVENHTKEMCPGSETICNNSSPGKSLGTHIQSSEACSRSNPVNVDANENLELNLVHSELSNDIFASLQVPPGCQNPESTSPTAAFLLAFPLVSSVKVTEVIDEDNSESQRETPTLLQIGTMDSMKSKHADTLLALDSFSFFNKDVCGNYYNSYSTEAKKVNESVEEKADRSTMATKSSSLRICEQITDEMVQALPSSSTTEFTYGSKIEELYVKQTKAGDNKKSNKFGMTGSLVIDPIQTAMAKSSNNKCPGIQDSGKKIESNNYNKFHRDSRENANSGKNIGEKRQSKVVESNTLSNEKQEKNSCPDNVCSIRKSKENYNLEMICKNPEKTVNVEKKTSNITTDNVKNVHNNVFEQKIEVCHGISLNTLNNTPQGMTREREHIPSKEKTENFIGIHKNVHNPESYNINHGSISKGNVSGNIGKNLENHCENITKAVLNEIPYIYESKPDLSRKIVADINISDFENIHNNTKDNKHINFSVANTNRVNISAPLMDKVSGTHYNSFHLKPPNPPSSSARNCDGTIASSKLSENVQFNLFEVAHTNSTKKIPTSLNNSPEKFGNPRSVDSNINSKTTVDHLQHHKKLDDTCVRGSGQKSQCYFPTSYPDASCSFNYRTNPSKICPTCSYMNLNKNCPNPLYTNCTNYNYNYPETNFNPNYYKPRSETKSYYTLNYENYQEHKKMDASTFTPKCYGNTSNYTKDGKPITDKEKCVTQNKPVNWMTTPDNRVQPPEPFLPAFANQSYSFASCNTGEASEVHSSIEPKKTDLGPLVPDDKQFSWSPTKLPNFLDTTANFVTPTLPTLVGDLALGNPLTFGEQKPECIYPKEPKRKNAVYDNQSNFLSVSQLVDNNKAENVPSKIAARRNSGNRAKNVMPAKNKKTPKNDPDKVSHVKTAPNNYNMLGSNDIFHEQKNRTLTKGMSSSYSAEALIGNQVSEMPKKYSSNSVKPVGSSNFLTENIINYFPAVDEGYMTQNQNMLHSFQSNTTYNPNTFVYTTPTISSTHVTSNFEAVGHDYPQDNFANVANTALKDNKTCSAKNYRPSNKDDKNVNYSSNVKRSRKKQTYESNNTGFDYPLLSMPSSTNSPILPDDFHSHANFLPPTAPYSSKNSFYQRQGNEFNSNALIPLAGLHLNSIQHPEASPSMNTAGTSLTNFNLSTIFPEINKGAISNMYPDHRNKEHSNTQQVPFNIDSKYTFPG